MHCQQCLLNATACLAVLPLGKHPTGSRLSHYCHSERKFICNLAQCARCAIQTQNSPCNASQSSTCQLCQGVCSCSSVALFSQCLPIAARDSKQVASDSSEEEEVGRSGAFGPKKVLPNQAHATAQRQQTQKKKGKKQKAGDNQAAAIT